MDGINQIDDLYALLKERKDEYVIWGEIVERLAYLYGYCATKQDETFNQLGGPVYWVIRARATKKKDRELGISPTERKIITILDSYEATFKNDHVALVKKTSDYPSFFTSE
ncbi:hypothetical protein [Isobaculum melis]|uniref:Uncharacterized protein n=1 Tax=Isobaculum melis TaxID=142588 RepID=A0A1H9QSA3_9LACT|nr:hypothetical protein [Isobaculum melis]SER63257.1 hypothetical protein SAMN04488559_102250 [Isobaculum melis]